MHRIVSAPTLRRLIARGEGKYWTKVGSRLYLRSALKLSEALDCAPPRWCVDIPLVQFEKLSTFRAALVESTFATSPNGKIVSQSTLGRITDRTRQTISRYLKGVRRERNATLTDIDPHALTERERDDGYFVTVIDGARVVMRHMPNRYHTNLTATGWGQNRRREVKDARHVFYAQSARPQRLYYESAGAGAKAINRLGDEDSVFMALKISGQDVRDVLGNRVWTRHTHWDAWQPGGVTNASSTLFS